MNYYTVTIRQGAEKWLWSHPMSEQEARQEAVRAPDWDPEVSVRIYKSRRADCDGWHPAGGTPTGVWVA